MIKNSLLLFFIVTCNYILFAQVEKNVDHQSLLWTRYYNVLELNKKWSLHSELDNRIFTNSTVQNVFVTRVQGRYKISNPVEVGSGFAYFSVNTADPNIETAYNKPEYRLQQDLTLKQDFGRINVNHRYQIEERFFQNFDSQGLKGGCTFAMRFRYKIQAEYTLWKNEKHYFKTILADEIMINAGSQVVNNTFDQNRIYAALRYGINESFAAEVGYMNSFQQRASGIDYYDRNIIRLSIFHKIKLCSKS
jgi:hypothetical protein